MQTLFIMSGVLLASIFSPSLSLAQEPCSVSDYRDAIACVRAWADEKDAEGELPHTVGVTSRTKGKKAFEEITGVKPTRDYVAVVEVHYDEDQIYYLEISKGENVKPVLRLSTGNVIIMDDLGIEGEASEEIVSKYRLHIDALEDFHL